MSLKSNQYLLEEVPRLSTVIEDPFIGPRPFRRSKEDQLLFFGRDDEADEIISLISAHRLVLIYAQSGAGKTSIFNAKVIPMLERLGFEVIPVARVRITSTAGFNPSSFDKKSNMEFSDKSNLYIHNTLQSINPKINSKELMNKTLSEFLNDYFPNQIDEGGDVIPQVLIFDQFEELFSFYPARWKQQRYDFFNQITQALERNSSLKIVFIIREDYIAEFDPYVRLLPEKLRPRFRLERLREESALSAIKGPLMATGVTLDSDDGSELEEEIKKIVNNLMKMQIEDPSGGSYSVDGEFVEPIHLQVVCQRWWKNRFVHGNNKRQIEQLGDLTDVDKALEDFYLEAIHRAISLDAIRFTGVNERDVREWCGGRLITSSGTRGIVHRGSNYTEGMNNKVVDILADEHLIRREWRAGSIWYELTHDRLIKPIKDSNYVWQHQQDLRKSKRSFRLRIAIPIIGVAVILALIGLSQYSSYSQPCSVIESQATVPLGGNPYGLDVNPNTNMIYIANYANDAVSVISCKANSVIQNITVGNGPYEIAVNPNTNMIYTANGDSDSVSVIDGKTNSVIQDIDVGDYPLSVAVNPNTNMIYTANIDSNTTSVIDGKTNSVIQDIAVGNNPQGVAVNPNTNMIYTANGDSNTTSVIDGKTNSVIQDIAVGNNPYSVAVNPNANTIYTANYDSDSVAVIDGKTNSVIQDITVGNGPYDIAVNPNTNMIYTANSESSTVSVINGTSNTIGYHYIGEENKCPSNLDINLANQFIFVLNDCSDTITVIDNVGGIMGFEYPLIGKSPRDIAFNTKSNTIYVADPQSNTLYTSDVSSISSLGQEQQK
jgi:YVTN family beta-propeller protein